MLFQIISERYFSVLSNKNKDLYLNIIFYLEKILSELLALGDNDKPKVIEIVNDYLDTLNVADLYDDDGMKIDINNKDRSRYIINKLVDTNWLIEEFLPNGRISIDFNDHSYKIIRLLKDIDSNNKLTYTSHIKAILNVINNFSYARCDDLLLINKYLENFIDDLRGLRSKINDYYKNITKNKTKENLQALLNEFLSDYKRYFFDESYVKLKLEDNVDLTIIKIKDKLEDIFSSFSKVELLINSLIDNKKITNYDDANTYFYYLKDNIFNNINMIPKITEMIDNKNEKYINRTISVIIHLINRSYDIEGILNRLIDLIKDHDIVDDFINIFEFRHYNYSLLARAKEKTVKVKPQILDLNDTFDEEVKDKALKIIKEDTKYNIEAVNKYVLDFLGDDDEKEISLLELDSKYDYIMLVSIIIYSKLIKAKYDISLLDDYIIKNNIKFKNFVVKRRI